MDATAQCPAYPISQLINFWKKKTALRAMIVLRDGSWGGTKAEQYGISLEDSNWLPLCEPAAFLSCPRPNKDLIWKHFLKIPFQVLLRQGLPLQQRLAGLELPMQSTLALNWKFSFFGLPVLGLQVYINRIYLGRMVRWLGGKDVCHTSLAAWVRSWNPCKDGRENDSVDLSFMYMFWHGYPTSNTQTINKLKKMF